MSLQKDEKDSFDHSNTSLPKQSRGKIPFLKGIRKKKSSDFAIEDTTETVLPTKKPKTAQGPLSASTTQLKKDKETFAWESNRSQTPSGSSDQLATAVNLIEAGVPHSRIRSGPAKPISIYARAISRFDYQPDICKDYKETGYCGYGDSCKFLHDRGDYKTGWQLEKEYDEQMQRSQSVSVHNEENYEIHEEDVPFACSICRGAFVDPVKTKCKHYYCEKCIVKKIKCPICNESTSGLFSSLNATEKQRLVNAREKFEREQRAEDFTGEGQLEKLEDHFGANNESAEEIDDSHP